MKKNPMRKVLVAMLINNTVSHRIFSGIMRYAFHRTNWNIRLLSYPEILSERVITEAERLGYDGLLVNYAGSAAKAIGACALPLSAIEVYNQDVQARRKRTAFVENDNREIGRAGARHLLTLGVFRSWGFVRGPLGAPWSNEREKGFLDTLAGAGFDATTFGGEGLDRTALANWILQLRKPAGIMCAWDMRAAEVLATCKEYGLSVPKDVCVIGVDGNDFICNATVPMLTSVAPDFERLGELAAESLDKIISSRSDARSFSVRCPPVRIVQGESTAAIPPSAALINKALSLITREATKGLKANDVASHLNISPQLLSMRFRQHVKSTVRETIIARKLEAVCRELKSTDHPLEQVASRCGFSSANRLAHLFKSRFGMSMGAYRRNNTSAGL